MVRSNEVRGPTSALTEFLRESGITPTTVARRARTANNAAEQPAADGPSNGDQDAGEAGGRRTRAAARQSNGYTSDQLDENEGDGPPAKKRKMSKAEQAKLKAKEKAKAKKKGGDKNDNDDGDDDYVEEEEDIYTSLSKSMYTSTRPPVGSFDTCVKCEQQFTVTKYTIAAVPPPGFLCHKCAKLTGSDPFKKPAVPKKRRAQRDKRKVVNSLEERFPTLVSMCIGIISRHIEDVEALGDIGSINMDEIAKALSRNRSLTVENAPLFYNIKNTKLTLYDVTNLAPPALCALGSLNPNLTSLRLDFCGRIDDSVLDTWCTSMPHLKHIDLLGPFLVRAAAWQTFFKSHPQLEGFLITQSPRFDIDCIDMLVTTCAGLKELRLKEVGKMSDEFLEVIGTAVKGGLTHLDLSYPGTAEALSEKALITLMKRIGSTLNHLDLSGNKNVTDRFLTEGIEPHMHRLESLSLANLDELTDEGVGRFFESWAQSKSNPALKCLDMSRNHELSSAALDAVLRHSGSRMTVLNIHGWKATAEESLRRISEEAKHLVKVNVGFCRGVNDFVIKGLLEECDSLKEIKCWGCNGVTVGCPRKKNVNVIGIA